MKLNLKKYKQEGDMAFQYNPLHNMLNENNEIVNFDTDQIELDMTSPINIECQPSYDGTVNLILNDDVNPPRIINTRFTKIEDNRYRVITRNQTEQTNLYKETYIDRQTRLFRTLNKIPKFSFSGLSYAGQLKGGNYTFYIKFADNDYNKTDIVAESGIIPVFKGNLFEPGTISGTLSDERTDKSINLRLTNIDTSFSKIYLYCSRETSDTNGIRISQTLEFVKPYEISGEIQDLVINGFEDTKEISQEELNIVYNTVDTVKTQAQVQNMLFFGNVTKPTCKDSELQNLSYYIQVKSSQYDNIGSVGYDYSAASTKIEYYNPQNIYYRLGYWPEELYRLGIVYILNNDTLSPVYNLRGCKFDETDTCNYDAVEFSTSLDPDTVNSNYKYLYKLEKSSSGETQRVEDWDGNYILNPLPKQDFLETKLYDNTKGVFKTSKANILGDSTKPLYYNMVMSKELIDELKKRKIRGFFIVRQRRIPTVLCQGLSIGINKECYIPMLYDSDKYIAESFVSNDTAGDDESGGVLTTNLTDRLLSTTKVQSSGLLCVDTMTNSILRSNFDGSEFVLERTNDTSLSKNGRHYSYKYKSTDSFEKKSSRMLFVDQDVPLKMIDTYGFSTRAGVDSDVSKFGFFKEKTNKEYTKHRPEVVRGIYAPFLGTTSKLNPASVYNVRIPNYSQAYFKDYITIRANDMSPFYAVSDRYDFDEISKDSSGNISLDVFRGDCYTNTVTVRLNRNFVDPTVPIDDDVIDENTWKDHYKGYYNAIYTNGKDANEDRQVRALETLAGLINGQDDDDKYTNFLKMNRADINAVPLGIWVTYKCLSNYNLGLRAVDRSYTDEQALMGNPRGFYPLNDISTKSSYKIPESGSLNDGYSSTVSKRSNFIYQDVPYIKDQFDNRIMFSNIQADDQFRNSYRIFQGLSYKDIDRQYGGIVKLIPWDANLLCVFEHGIGLVPINQKALMNTTDGQSIHLYGAGVLQSQVSVYSDAFGSIWEDSIVKTPIGVYGVDTTAKKIWRVTRDKGIEMISDMKVQKFLNEHILLKEADKYPLLAVLDVKSHYNNYKGDVMFTFYDKNTDEEWNLCFNERLDKWITKYSWTPLFSENINNIFVSCDKKRVEVYADIYDNRNCTYGIRTSSNKIDNNGDYDSVLSFQSDYIDKFTATVQNIEFSYLSEGTEYFMTLETDKVYVTSVSEVIHLKTNIDELLTDINNNRGENPEVTYENFCYFIVNLKVVPVVITSEGSQELESFITRVGVLYITNANKESRNTLLTNGFYIHGRAGIFDELNYHDEDRTNQILPTKWYGKQEPFELEFVVNGDVGLHKIFQNLVIISNNVQPETLEFEIIGDAFNFNKAGIYWNKDWQYAPLIDKKYRVSQQFKDNVKITWDNDLNQYSLRVSQECKNINTYGRAKGNIQYKEDSWYTNIEPILFKNKVKIEGQEEMIGEYKSIRLKDKFCKVRIKYSGEDLVIITALKTMVTLSYS